MKIQISKTEGLKLNHNVGGLKVKPQVVQSRGWNHNLGGLKVNR